MNQRKCECPYHRYHVVHVYENVIFDHSQSTWDSFRNIKGFDPEKLESFPSELYKHGMTANDLRLARKKKERI